MARRLRFIGLAAVSVLLAYLMLWRPQSNTDPKRIQVRFWHMWTAEWKDVVDKIVTRFNKSQDKYEVVALSVPSSGADSKFLMAVAGGNPPDCMAQWNAVIPTWAQSGLIKPLDDFMTPEQKRQFDAEAYPAVKKIGTYKGRLYALTIGMNLFALYYLPDQLVEAGYKEGEFPKSIEELTQVAARLNRFEGKRLKRLGFMPSSLLGMAEIFGGGYWDPIRQRVTVENPKNLEALEYIADEWKMLGYDNVTKFNSGLNTASFAGGWPFLEGYYSITIDGQWRVEQARKYKPNLKYSTIAIPPPKGGRKLAGLTGGNFMIIPAGAKQAEGAWEFIKFWSGLENPERAAEFYTWGGWLPLSPRVAKAPKYQAYLKKYPQFKTFLDMMPSENIQPLPPVPYQTFLNDEINRAEDYAVRGTLTPKQAMADLRKRLDHEIKRRKELGYED